MKVLRFFIASIVVLLSTLPAHAQNNWFKITVPGMNRIELLQFLDRDTGYVIGVGNDSFYLCKTTTGGREWESNALYPEQLFLPPPIYHKQFDLTDFHISTSEAIYALGTEVHYEDEAFSSHFLLKGNLASNWQEIRNATIGPFVDPWAQDRLRFFTGPLTAFTFIAPLEDHNKAYRLYRDTLIAFSPPSKVKYNFDYYEKRSYYDIAFADSARALSSTDSGFFYSADTGKTWSFIDTNSLGITRLAYGGNDSWLGTAPRKGLFHTVDTGKTWQPLLQSNSQSYSFDLKEKIGYVATDSELFVTTDQGQHWDRYDYKFKKVQALDEEIGFAITPKGELYKTATGGKPNLTVTELTQEVSVSKGFTLYPQPASQQVTVAFPNSSGEKVVRVVNSIGQVVLWEVVPAGQRSLPLRVAALRNGLYFVETGGKSHPLLIRH